MAEEGNLRRHPVQLSGTALAIMSFQTLGIIYSDIGTSPLYVLNGIWPSYGPTPPKEDVIGGLSAIIWAMTILPLIKYTLIALRFGTSEGEGGTFALLQGLYPRDTISAFQRTLTSDSDAKGRAPERIERGQSFLSRGKWLLYLWSFFGTSLTLGDGIFTPAVSVTSAVGGLAVAKPSVINQITPISIGFLLALFLVQRFGTHKITFAFAPVTFGWLVLIGATGIYNITKYPGIFRAFDPSRAILWFVRTKNYDALAGVLLALTGCEAMFANLGQFNALSIQLAFGLFVYPSLLLAYLGQGARLITDGGAVMSNIFYMTIPGPPNGALYWIVFVFALLATIIASQALITATFSLTQQLINMKALPPLRLVYTSSVVQGQVYVPAANYTLGLATVIIVGVFKNLTNLTNAYGFAVATVMFVTTSFLSIHIYIKKGLPLGFAVGFLLTFGFFDGLFWGAALRKVTHGAWVPLTIGCILCALMMFWTWAKGLEDAFDGKNRRNPRSFIVHRGFGEKGSLNRGAESDPLDIANTQQDTENNDGEIIEEDQVGLAQDTSVVKRTNSALSGDDQGDGLVDTNQELFFLDESSASAIQLPRIPTCAIFHKLTGGRGVPHSFYGYVRQMPSLPRVVIFLSVQVLPIAYVATDDAYIVSKVRSIQGFYGVTYCLGFRDDFNPSTEQILKLIYATEARLATTQARQVIGEVQLAATRTVHIIPHYRIASKDPKIELKWASIVLSWLKRFLIESLYARLSTMFPETANWALNHEDILHVGVNAAI
ncbi:potassium transporter [Cantharellus anzutake]|uniref:potassium transporter n=1 Tax=Cantharellus anzutake TaxID=1750568 RepID=UPI0019076A23|nr:potassium transporter [Cantharellus anzutake]KAF8321383.1 potassium transporter [Cantharellus anzutake]